MIFSLRVYVLKEKAGKSANVPKNKESKDLPFHDGSSLVLSIDKDGKITKFNKECEEILGYNEKEALNRNIFDFLIPDHHHDQWRTLLDYSLNNKMVDDFQLPLLTKNGQEILVCWNNFPIKDTEGAVVDISLVGNLLKSLKDSGEQLPEHPEYEIQGFSIEDVPKAGKTVKEKHPVETIEKVQQIDEDIDQKNAVLEDNFQNIRSRWDQFDDRKQTQDIKSRFARFARKKRKQDLESPLVQFDDATEEQDSEKYDEKMQELNERESILNKLESKIAEDKVKISGQADTFKRWREKLERLDEQLENKRQLLSQEPLIADQARTLHGAAFKGKKDDEVKEHRVILDKIPDCAAVVQRGILKQVNASFADLVGYNVDEIVDKSLFDFIVPEGFSDLERYYLDRLKGEEVSVYETVFLTKDNDKIFVEVSTKPTLFNGVKAEIAVFKKLKNKTKESK